MAGLKKIYQADTKALVEANFLELKEKWGNDTPLILNPGFQTGKI